MLFIITIILLMSVELIIVAYLTTDTSYVDMCKWCITPVKTKFVTV